MNSVVCLHTGDRTPLRWTRNWKVADRPVRVDVYRESDVYARTAPGSRPRPVFEVYCADEPEAAHWASCYERRGFLAEVVHRGE